MKYLTNLDLNKNELQNTVIQNLGAAPSSPKKGQIYMDSGLNRAFVWDGTNWIGMDSYDAEMTGADIVTAINGSTSIINNNNLSTTANSAITNSHTHSNKAVLDATTASFTTADETKLDGIQAGAQVNAVTSVAGKTGAVSLTSSDVGLGSVTNNAQMKKIASSTNGYIPTWSGTTGDLLATGYSVETTLSGGTGSIPRADAVKSYIDGLLSASDAMVFKGTLGSGGTITALPTSYSAGWTYKVITAGTYAGIVCEIGDLIIAVIDRSGSGNLNGDWVIVQTNLDGAVTGPSSATSDNFVLFDGTTGKLIKNSSYNASSFALASHTHSEYTKKYSANVGDGTNTSYVITHNLNSQDLAVSLREVASPYALVLTDIEFTSVNTLTVKFASAPSLNQYKITIVG
jgi:Cu/Ag efflux protein CusF